MDITKDIVEKVTETVMVNRKKAVDKAKQMAEIAGLKNQIAACEEVVRKNYMEIGRMTVAQYKKGMEGTESMPDSGNASDSEEVFCEKQCRAVVNAQAGIKDLERKLREVKASGRTESGTK